MALISAPADLISGTSILIGSDWLEPAGAPTYRHIYAGSGQPTGEIRLGGGAEIDAAIAAARAALPGWRQMPAAERGEILNRVAGRLRADAETIGLLETLDNATPTASAKRIAATAAAWFAHNAGWADKISGQTLDGGSGDAFDYVDMEPYGVVAVIIPWNGPVVSMGMVLGPALAAGNCVVFKPPELAPYACRRIMQHLLDAGVPPGVVNMVTGGPESGRRLVAHPGIDKIHFTGSPQTARSILATAAENITACALELGGKSANVIFADADLDAALPQAMNAIIGKSGQGCIRGTRILAERTVYDEVVERCAAIARTARLGDPMLDTTIMGPVISEAACQRILRTIERATREEGGRLVAGGRRADGELAPGYYLEATVISDVAPQSDLAQNEVFGPVIAVMPFDGEDEALRLANSTPYALAAYVQTNDGGRAHRMARRMNAGNVWINGFGGILPGVPFGGNGISGFGRLGGEAGIKEFLRPKNVWMKL